MKAFVVASFLAACLAACTSSPVALNMVDWAAVSTKTSELQDTVWNAARDIQAMASNENTMVGTAVEMKIWVAYAEASSISDLANAEIEAQTLTETRAKAMVGQLRGVMGKLKGSIARDIAMLSPMTAAQIRAAFDVTFDVVNMRAEELYALLRQ